MIAKYAPRPKLAAVHVYPDKREVCNDNAAGKREYFRRTRLMAARQDENCALCGKFMVAPTFDHERTRRVEKDERIEVDGKWKNAALCLTCQGVKGSRRYAWIDGVYQAVQRITNQGDMNGLLRDPSGLRDCEANDRGRPDAPSYRPPAIRAEEIDAGERTDEGECCY